MTQVHGEPDVRVPLMVGAIGHRDLVAEECDDLRRRVAHFLTALQRKYPELRVTVLTSLAEGADRLVADVTKSLGVPIIYVLPMPTALFEQDFEGESLDEYRRLANGSTVLTLPLVGGSTADDVRGPGPARDMQYAVLGTFIAAHCHILLALWDGIDSSAVGGTASVIHYHQDDFMPGLSDGEPRTRLDDTDDESDLVYQIVCSRRGAESAQPLAQRPGEVWWLSRNAEVPRTAEMPPRYEIVLRRMVEFSLDRKRHQALIERAPPALVPPDADVDIDNGARTIAELFTVADCLAVHYQRLTLNALRWLCAFAAAASVSFVAYGDFAEQQQMIYPYLAFMAAMLGMNRIAQRGDWQRRYVDYRVLAEALRVQFYWALAHVERPAPSRFGHDSFLKRQDLELGWIRNMLRVTGLADDAVGRAASAAGIAIAARDWVGDSGHGQLHYYSSRWPLKLRRHRVTEMLGTSGLALGLLLAGWLACIELWSGRQPDNVWIALMGLLPVGAAIRQWYEHRTGDQELIRQFRFMDRIFANARRQLSLTMEPREQQRILRELGDAAMGEHGQWILRLRERPISTVG